MLDDPKKFLVVALSAAAGVALAVVTVITVLSLLLLNVLNSGSTIIAAVAANCANGNVVQGVGIGTHPKDMTKEQVAATIYAQVKGLGYGDMAALLAISSASAENTNLRLGGPDGTGDGGYGTDATSSRGILQQFSHWIPEKYRWSGQRPPCDGNQECRDRFNKDTAWGPNGWAENDLRMNPAHAATAYVLGSYEYGLGPGSGVGGLDDPDLPNKDLLTVDNVTTKPSAPTWDRLFEMSKHIQGFNTGDYWHRQNMETVGWPLYEKIVKGEIPVPAFVPPVPEVAEKFREFLPANMSTSPAATVAPAVAPATNTSTPGLLVMGDSNMEGIAGAVNMPATLMGGDVIVDTIPSVSLNDVVSRDSFTFEDRTVNLKQWREHISKGPSTILVMLGVNDGKFISAGDLDAFMNLAGPNRRVFWYTPFYSGGYEQMNQVLQGGVAQYPNLMLVDVGPAITETYGALPILELHPYDAYANLWDAAMSLMGGSYVSTTDANGCESVLASFAVSGPIPANPGSTPLNGPEQALPAFGYSINVDGGRNMTYYNQGDPRWASMLWGGGQNMQTCGCATNSMAMVIATLANKPDFTPDQLLPEQKANPLQTQPCGTNHPVVPPLLQAHGLQAELTPYAIDWDRVDTTLKAGGLVIVSVQGNYPLYTGDGHYMVIRAKTADGKYLVADPGNNPNSSSAGFASQIFNIKSGTTYVLPGNATPGAGATDNSNADTVKKKEKQA